MAAPFGSWPSPVTPEDLVATIPPSSPDPAEDGLYWLELRPEEKGRSTLVFGPRGGGEPRDLTPVELNVRSRVHEYGGGAVWRDGETIFFSNYWDGRLFRQDGRDSEPRPITREPATANGLRYADGIVDDGLILCVLESHEGDAVENQLVAFATDGSDEPRTIASGRDFYAAPRLNPDGTQLAFLAWDHPLLPFVGCDLCVARYEDGVLREGRKLAGGPGESIFQPEWSPDGVLHFVSDRTGWWNLYRLRDSEPENLTPIEAEFAYPHWQLGYSRYAFLDDGRIAVTFTRQGSDRLAVLDAETRELDELDLPFTSILPQVRAHGKKVAFVAASETEPAGLFELDAVTGELTVWRASPTTLPPEWISRPEHVEFPGSEGRPTFAFYYPPTNPDVEAPSDERPPLRVLTHGGPTGHSSPEFQTEVQYWTSRGIAVVDVNYGGSTGYGRAYRERLDGAWGVVDVEDCVAAAKHLVDTGRADESRVYIEGGSAGGYTTLCALVFTDAFAAGVNHFGVTDLETFARDTHKFEERYLDLLVGPYPERKDLYAERSPVNHFDRLSCPVLTYQGLDDRVVPPSQSEQLVEALRRKGIPYAYLAFEGEGHGFRKRESILRVPAATLYFLSKMFGFEPADELEPIPIEGLD